MDLLDDPLLPVAPHPDVDFGLPPLDLDKLVAEDAPYLYDWPSRRAILASTLDALVEELRQLRGAHARPSPNGEHGYKTTCHGCGAEVTVKRRPIPGKRSWCDDCKANGEPAAQRARDYRSRKGEK